MKQRTLYTHTITTRAIAYGSYAVVMSFGVVGFPLLAPSAHAASLADVVASPVSTVQNVTAPIVSPLVSAPSQTTTTATQATPAAQNDLSDQTPASQTQTTAMSSNSGTTDSNSTQPSAAASATRSASSVQPSSLTVQSAKVAGDQSVEDASPISYVSRQISKASAGALYLFAGSVLLLGLGVYALTLRRSGKGAKKVAVSLRNLKLNNR